jgi:hypothetical protein
MFRLNAVGNPFQVNWVKHLMNTGSHPREGLRSNASGENNDQVS